jgi:hypothetical protein
VRSHFSLISLFLGFRYDSPIYVCMFGLFYVLFLFGCSESRGKEEKIIRLLVSFSRVLVF